ncbi:MAG: QueT transporter family protein [Solobacterium sp.]|nr:QueT transporter family protein [Solobacterium sp.]
MTTKRFTRIAMTAAIYTAVSLALAPLSYGPVQVRIAEALTMLPLIWQPAIPALTIGCLLTNVIGTATGVTGPIDIVVGTLATFLAAVCTYRLKDRTVAGIPLLSILMPVLFNGVFVGTELAWMLNPGHMMETIWIYGLEVAAGELISVIVGYILVRQLKAKELFEEK